MWGGGRRACLATLDPSFVQGGRNEKEKSVTINYGMSGEKKKRLKVKVRVTSDVVRRVGLKNGKVGAPGDRGHSSTMGLYG